MREFLFCFVVLLTVLSSCKHNYQTSDIFITELLCENQSEPNNIDNPNPRLTWKMNSRGKGQLQSAYQILVASSEEKLNTRKADIWNSGKVNSDESVLVPYSGKSLESGKRYYFTVRVWDSNDAVSEYTKPSFWESAIINKEEWKAKWISAPRVFDWYKRGDEVQDPRRTARSLGTTTINYDNLGPLDPLPLFRKSFRIEKKIKSAKAYISGLGFFEFYVNNKKIGDHLLTPTFTDYTKTVLYDVLDFTSVLSEGENIMGVMLGNGWYNHVSNDVWGYNRASWRDDPVLICQVEIEYEDGTREQILSNESWKCYPGPIVYSSLRLGETYDARKEERGWSGPEYDDTDWHKVRIVRGTAGVLKAQNAPPTRIITELSAKIITRLGNNKFILDFGQNMSGFIKLKASGKIGNKVSFRYAEKLTEEGMLDQSNINHGVGNERFQTDEYIFRGEGVEEWHPRFNYHGFRYVEVSGWNGVPDTGNIKACFVHADFRSESKFSCSSPLINRIQENTLWAFGSNYVSIPTDNPHREKNGWIGVSQLAHETGLYNFNMMTSYEKWINDLIDAQDDKGTLPSIVPTGGWGYFETFWNTGSSIALLNIPWNLYVYEKDKKIVADVYPSVKKFLEWILDKTDDGIVNWGHDPCRPYAKGRPPTTTPMGIISTAWYYKDLIIASKMADLLEYHDDSNTFQLRASEVKEAFSREYFDSGTGQFKYPTQTGLGAALYSGIVDSAKANMLLNELVNVINESDFNLDFGVFGAKFVPNALSYYGQAKVAFGFINSTEYPGWGNCVANGATTIWEFWNRDAALNQIAFGDISAWLFKNLAGIMPDEKQPGFKHCVIKPFFADDIDWVKAEKQTPYGNFKVNWQKSIDTIKIIIDVPVNTSASLFLPAGELSVYGKVPVSGFDGINDYDTINNSINIGSGNFEFELISK